MATGIFRGSADYSKGYIENNELLGVYYGLEPVIDAPSPFFYHEQFAGDDTNLRTFSTGHKSASVWHITNNAGTDPLVYNVYPYITFNTDGEYQNTDRDYIKVNSTNYNDYNGVGSVAVFDRRSITYGNLAIGFNGSDFNDHNLMSFRLDGVTDLSAGGDLTCKGFNNQGTGVQHVIYTGDGVGSRTFAHGCGVKPSFYIIRGLEGSRNQYFGGPVVGAANGTGDNSYGLFADTAIGNDTFCFASFDENIVTLGSSVFQDWTNNNSLYWVQFFYDVAGVCASGTISAAGGSVHTETLGFEPAFIILIHPGGKRYIVLQDGQTTGTARTFEFNGNSNEDDGRSTSFTTTADGFTIADGHPGNDGASTLGYVALAKG